MNSLLKKSTETMRKSMEEKVRLSVQEGLNRWPAFYTPIY